MKREDIEKKASEYAGHQVNPLKNINHTRIGLAMYANDVAAAFEAGAEWMKEQCDAENDKALAKHLLNDAELRNQIIKIREDDDRIIARLLAEVDDLTNLVSAKDGMIAQMAERMEELDDKVSELTEALDASSIFCEGVKEHYIKKACEWAEEWFSNDEEWMRRTSFIDGIKEELTKAMKGE